MTPPVSSPPLSTAASNNLPPKDKTGSNNEPPEDDNKKKDEEQEDEVGGFGSNGSFKRKLDFQKIRDILQEETNAFLKGVKNTDVDWFIRDTGANYTIQIPPATAPTQTEEKSDKLQDKAPDQQVCTPEKNKQANGSLKEQPSSPNVTVSPHLNTTISNTNDNYETKTKPSIGLIQEEMAIPYGASQEHQQLFHQRASTGDIMKSSRRRSSAMSQSSASTSTSVNSIGGGLFSKLKYKFHKMNDVSPSPPASSYDIPPPSPQSPPKSSSTTASSTLKPPFSPTKNQAGLFKNDYDLALKKKNTNASLASGNSSLGGPISPPSKHASKPCENLGIISSSPTSHIFDSANVDDDAYDPRLDEYIKFYQQKDIRRSSISSRSSSVDLEKYPPALVNGFENTTYNQSMSSSPPKDTTSKLSSFLRRKTATISSSSRNESNASLVSATSSIPAHPPAPISGLDLDPSFKGLKPLKRVAFHSTTFLIDPPQQIPSRTPRKGNVELLPNGSYKIHPLTEEDKLAIEKSQMGLGGGIVVGGTGALGYMKKDETEEEDEDKKKKKRKDSTAETDEDKLEQEDSDSENSDEETAIDTRYKSFNIDKPMIPHQPLLKYSVPVEKMALDTMYSRCCHLREILPIPAVLKQIPKNSMTPLSVLQLRNPNPTMVEIQTFADFVRIAPIICISLDGVNLSVDQFKILLSAMSAKKQLEKLSLRNTPINEQGWSLLCWFLSRNKVLNKLDITQCPSIAVNILKKKRKKSIDSSKKKYEEEIERMTCNMDNRSDMDWSLFIATLIARDGIEELILTGCCIPDILIFEKLIKLAISKRTSRLGLAFSQLTPRHFKILVDNWIFQDFARGLDLGYNDFSNVSMLKILLDYSKRPDFDKILSNSTLSFLSLNSTNNAFTDMFKEVFETILLKLPNLKYLDVSNNQKLFGTFGKIEEDLIKDSIPMSKPISIGSTNNSNSNNEASIISYFTSKFPLFPKLIRLHLENENFSQASIVTIAKVLPFCKNLGYFSIMGNKVDLIAASCLINAVKNSKTLINLDCNIDLFPELFRERIGLYTMRNMERLLYNSQKVPSISKEEETESLTEQLNSILSLKAQQKLDLQSDQVKQFFSRIQRIRRELSETIDELHGLQLKNGLDLDGKETLIRFIFIKESIEKGLQLIDPNLAEEEYFKEEQDKQTKDVVSIQSEEESPNEEEIDVKNSPMRPTRTNSRTSLIELSKEEGSVLKLSKLTQFHHLDEDEDYSNMSGEELRQKMMSVELSDLDKMIGFLENLRGKGITLEKLFKKHHAQFKSQTHDLLDLDEVRKKLKAMIENDHTDKDKGEAPASQKPDHEQQPEQPIMSTHEMNETYDKVLQSITKVIDDK
ncbi:MAP-ous protein 1 [Spathaspora sp. JA1]|nr:MAP-ous protein 1 [Spathaspora sp. JA1]